MYKIFSGMFITLACITCFYGGYVYGALKQQNVTEDIVASEAQLALRHIDTITCKDVMDQPSGALKTEQPSPDIARIIRFDVQSGLVRALVVDGRFTIAVGEKQLECPSESLRPSP